MNKKTLLLILGLALASMVFADLGFFVSFNSNETLKVFTSQYIADKPPAPAFRDTLIVLSSFQPNRQEFLVFGNIIRGENVLIENGISNVLRNSVRVGDNDSSVTLRMSSGCGRGAATPAAPGSRRESPQ